MSTLTATLSEHSEESKKLEDQIKNNLARLDMKSEWKDLTLREITQNISKDLILKISLVVFINICIGR